VFFGMMALSLFVHASALVYLQFKPPRPPPPPSKPIEMVVVEVEPPKPPEPPKPEPEPAKPPPVKIAKPVKPPDPLKEELPPPPNDTPPPEPTKPVPLVVGLTMQSTTTAGNFAAQVGNTLYGKTAGKAASPDEVKPYAAPKYVPVYQVDSEPRLLREAKVYPEEAKKLQLEGSVVLRIKIDETGKVIAAKIIRRIEPSLDEAALKQIYEYKFSPAIKGGVAVATEIDYTVTFLMD